jgi:carbon-monoxide dehydrogenase medium subunit
VAHADPASELPAVLLALDGWVTLRSAVRGERIVQAEDFFRGFLFTAREPDEVVTKVTFPRFRGATAFLEVARRPGDFALAGTCLALRVDDGVVGDVRISLAGVSDRPIRPVMRRRY